MLSTTQWNSWNGHFNMESTKQMDFADLRFFKSRIKGRITEFAQIPGFHCIVGILKVHNLRQENNTDFFINFHNFLHFSNISWKYHGIRTIYKQFGGITQTTASISCSAERAIRWHGINPILTKTWPLKWNLNSWDWTLLQVWKKWHHYEISKVAKMVDGVMTESQPWALPKSWIKTNTRMNK